MPVEFRRGERGFTFALVLSGGNALGAFQAGAYQALHEAGLEPDWVIGTSAGAVNAALIAGNAPADRVAKLKAFWRPQGDAGAALSAFRWDMFETLRRSIAAQWSMVAGRTGVFGPLLSGPVASATGRIPAIFDTTQLAASLATLVDFERLNGGDVRFTTTAVDIESGEDVIFDSTSERIEVDHVRASAALPIAFPAIQLGERWLVDGGLSANLALDPFFESPPAGRSLCIALDLLPVEGKRPQTLGEAASRMQDLLFAAQSRRSIARWADHFSRSAKDAPSIAFARLAYTAQHAEIAGKAMDFSPESVGDRWRAGQADMTRLLAVLQDQLPKQKPGLSIVNVAI